MQPSQGAAPFKCFRYFAKGDLAGSLPVCRISWVRHFSASPPAGDELEPKPKSAANEDKGERQEREPGAMSRKLAQMTEEGLESGGRRAANIVQEAGFDEALKKQLEERIAGANFRNEYASAFAQAELPSSAGRGTRDIAAAKAWTGTESIEDASLRMLDDSIKPMRGPARPPGLRGPPSKVDTGRSRSKASSGARLANARDRTSTYAHMKEMPDDERAKFRQELKERFSSTSRAVPVSISGLESLANERIDDAIARGQFKNLPRGKKIERDYNASSPFINTTEYLLNRMIQRQDIVPPWIEKQQELVSTAARFRGRIRADWRRHVARTIASRGGSLEFQMKAAEDYAVAEAIHNPRSREKKVERLNTVDEAGHLSQVTIAGELRAAESIAGDGQSEQLKVMQETIDPAGDIVVSQSEVNVPLPPQASPSLESATIRTPSVTPFRDPDWLRTEQSYHRMAVENLNTLTRSYNLMCPQLAQRPYFDLQRELNACFAEVAPLVAKEIRDRATAPKQRVESFGSKSSSVLEKFAGHKARVYDEQKPRFGFRELLKEWFSKDKSNTY